MVPLSRTTAKPRSGAGAAEEIAAATPRGRPSLCGPDFLFSKREICPQSAEAASDCQQRADPRLSKHITCFDTELATGSARHSPQTRAFDPVAASSSPGARRSFPWLATNAHNRSLPSKPPLTSTAPPLMTAGLATSPTLSFVPSSLLGLWLPAAARLAQGPPGGASQPPDRLALALRVVCH